MDGIYLEGLQRLLSALKGYQSFHILKSYSLEL